MRTIIITISLIIGHAYAEQNNKPLRSDYINKRALLKELYSGREAARVNCFKKPSQNYGREMITSEYCGAYQALDLLIHDIEGGNLK